ncbi:hypothetical protein DNTS_013517 [Danionella cerebrum]|uniref:Tyrosine specific protein phosphatases domain-containing protein n=1 Tax=Danionella cerebrum TaxID=2873325 RepID=A0A553QNP5_9TELE|nr:hypothetical protein DNTS_013517 [Danionella translucida]
MVINARRTPSSSFKEDSWMHWSLSNSSSLSDGGDGCCPPLQRRLQGPETGFNQTCLRSWSYDDHLKLAIHVASFGHMYAEEREEVKGGAPEDPVMDVEMEVDPGASAESVAENLNEWKECVGPFFEEVSSTVEILQLFHTGVSEAASELVPSSPLMEAVLDDRFPDLDLDLSDFEELLDQRFSSEAEPELEEEQNKAPLLESSVLSSENLNEWKECVGPFFEEVSSTVEILQLFHTGASEAASELARSSPLMEAELDDRFPDLDLDLSDFEEPLDQRFSSEAEPELEEEQNKAPLLESSVLSSESQKGWENEENYSVAESLEGLRLSTSGADQSKKEQLNVLTARDQEKLQEMGITHVLNAAAPCDPLLEITEPTEQEDPFPAWNRFYANMKITHCALPATCHQFNMIRYFMPAARFMANVLRKPENKLLIHCRDGVNQSPTLFLAYLIMYCNMCLEEAIDHLRIEDHPTKSCWAKGVWQGHMRSMQVHTIKKEQRPCKEQLELMLHADPGETCLSSHFRPGGKPVLRAEERGVTFLLVVQQVTYSAGMEPRTALQSWWGTPTGTPEGGRVDMNL